MSAGAPNMSWFSSFAPAVFAPAAEPAAEEGYSSEAPTLAIPTLGSKVLPVEKNATGVPRGKAPAKGKLLPKWEMNSSSSSDEDIMGDGSDDGPMSPAGAHGTTPQTRDAVPFGEEDEARAAAVRAIKPLMSYEEAVWKLKDPRQGRKNGLDDDDEKNPAAHAMAKLKLMNELKMREKLLEEENITKEHDAQLDSLTGAKALTSSRVIVGVAKVKLNMIRQKMKLYEEAEFQGTEQNLRARKLLTWMASLAFLQKFDAKMRDPGIKEAKRMEYLRQLEPPPPPPPPEEPPDSEDEELHEKYEAMIRRYEKQWLTEGHKTLGKDRFTEIQNMRGNGPAAREKKEIARRCIEDAHHVMNEADYQELLKKAWRLTDDHSDLVKDYDPAKFRAQMAKSSAAAEK